MLPHSEFGKKYLSRNGYSTLYLSTSTYGMFTYCMFTYGMYIVHLVRAESLCHAALCVLAEHVVVSVRA